MLFDTLSIHAFTVRGFVRLFSKVAIYLIFCAFVAGGACVSQGFAQEAEAKGGAGAAAAPSVSEIRFDDWVLRCVAQPIDVKTKPDASAKAACELAQSVKATLSGKEVPVLEIAVSPAADKAGKARHALVVLTPLDVLLSSDFGLQIGKGKQEVYRYRNCNHLGCFAVVPLTRERLNALVASRDAAMFFRLLDGQTVKIMVSLKGFGQALEAFSAKAGGK